MARGKRKRLKGTGKRKRCVEQSLGKVEGGDSDGVGADTKLLRPGEEGGEGGGHAPWTAELGAEDASVVTEKVEKKKNGRAKRRKRKLKLKRGLGS